MPVAVAVVDVRDSLIILTAGCVSLGQIFERVMDNEHSPFLHYTFKKLHCSLTRGVTYMTYAWPRKRPESEDEFECEMGYVDAHLYESGFIPAQRPHIFPRCFADAFGDVTHIYPDDALADEPGFSGNELVAKGHRWYRDVYGNRLNHPYELGFAPVELGNAIWRFSVPQTYGGKCEYMLDRNLDNFGTDSDGNPLKKGTMIYATGIPVKKITINCLSCVDDLPQGMTNRLSDAQLNAFLEWCRITITGLSWFVDLFWRVSYDDKHLFYTAFAIINPRASISFRGDTLNLDGIPPKP